MNKQNPEQKNINLKDFLLVLLYLLLLTSIFFNPYRPLEKITSAIVKHPDNPYLHLNLSELASAGYDWGLAQSELKKAYQLISVDSNKSIAGISSKFEDVSRKAYTQENITKEIAYWLDVIGQQPEYKDAYLKLALLNYQLNRNNEAFSLWYQAWILDPNNDTVVKIGNKLKLH